jgi:hypothetical protein
MYGSCNLLEETISKIEHNGCSVKDVQWVGNEYRCISWEEFVKIANIVYDEGFGGTRIAYDLMVVGKDWWLERHEYDGNEWWEYKKMPIKPNNIASIETVCDGSSGSNLEDMNDVYKEE